MVPAADDRVSRIVGDFSQRIGNGCAVYMSTASMPEPLREAFAKLTTEKSFELANPGQRFQVSDVVMGQNVPLRRLKSSGRCGDTLFIHYGRGGDCAFQVLNLVSF